MPRILLCLLAIATLAPAQHIDLEGLAGGGAIKASGRSLASGQFGIQACFLCSGRLGLFTEYTHWVASTGSSRSNPSDLVRRADLAGIGLRIQGRGRISPFFDVGVAFGQDDHRAPGNGGALGGIVTGGGVRIPLRGNWYLRPQVRAYGLTPHGILEGLSPHFGIGGLAGVGYSWK
jgi:hypothetical protein